jgi:sarcosine oxidase, subunit gamma
MGEAAAFSPLAHRVPDLEHVTQSTRGAIEIAEIAFLAQVGLRIDPELAEHLGLNLAVESNTHIRGDDGPEILWLGPDEWLLVGRPGTAPSIATELEQRLSGIHHSVVDLSSDRATLELRSPARFELLSKGCSIDLRPTVWASGTCAQTLLAGTQVLLQERLGNTRVYVRPSFADYVVDWVVDASVEYSEPSGMIDEG